LEPAFLLFISFSNCSEKFIRVDFEKYRISEGYDLGSEEFVIDKVKLKIVNNELILKGKVCFATSEESPFEGVFLIRENKSSLIDTIGVTNQKGLFEVKFLLSNDENDNLIFSSSSSIFRNYKFNISQLVKDY
jgi:hypothetical protein